MDVQTKVYAIAEVKSLETENPNGEFEVILSTPAFDRDEEIVDAKIFEPLPDHITFDIDHGMSTATTVGSGVPRYDGDLLKVKGTFSSIPRAQEVRTLVAEGHIRSTSVAMMKAVREDKDGIPHVVSAELLNGAFVPIPANREAVVLSAKGYAAKAGARNSTKDAERLQTIHDLAVTNGAACVTPEKSISRGGLVRKGHGMTANDLREALDNAVREAHGSPDGYTWVRDYTDEWVVFEASEPDSAACWQESYTVADGAVTLTGDALEVVAHTTYEQVTAPTDSATQAPETPGDKPGKSPASAVVDGYARLRADAALLVLPD